MIFAAGRCRTGRPPTWPRTTMTTTSLGRVLTGYVKLQTNKVKKQIQIIGKCLENHLSSNISPTYQHNQVEGRNWKEGGCRQGRTKLHSNVTSWIECWRGGRARVWGVNGPKEGRGGVGAPKAISDPMKMLRFTSEHFDSLVGFSCSHVLKGL